MIIKVPNYEFLDGRGTFKSSHLPFRRGVPKFPVPGAFHQLIHHGRASPFPFSLTRLVSFLQTYLLLFWQKFLEVELNSQFSIVC